MTDLASTPTALPLFPLNSVLFPDMLLPLHVFEPRYRLLVQRCLDAGTPFGIVLIQEGEEVGPAAIPHRIGTLAEIVAHAPLADGRSLITVRGSRRFEIDSVVTDVEPYLVGHVRYLDDAPEETARRLADTVAEAYADYVVGVVAATAGVRREVPVVDEIQGGSPCDVSYRVAAGLAVEDDERQMLLETATTRERLVREREILSRECALLTEMLVRMRARGEGPTLH
ncbi:MAG: LON peptidase substrate-binding domain-containing protein [Chloroflexota bacterium]|nr:LON peptidase substrate-binding domain-containing protein [Chloroflexota bacterium]MDE3192909.1 LON peptidase substrate-binding domain-containing protein [Chloroflexota bacterium]